MKNECSFNFSLTPGVHDAFCDFAAYNALSRAEMSRMYAVEQTPLIVCIDLLELMNIEASSQEAFGALYKSKGRKVMQTKVPEATHQLYVASSERLHITFARLAKMAVLHGCVEDMKKERFVAAARV